MKYIRTKDGIYDIEKSTFHFFEGGIEIVSYCKQFEQNLDLCKTANTIEELCDYVFLFDDELTIRKITHENDKDLIEWLKECIELGMQVKLAILTDKGLIYIAELNDKGVLCLI